MRTKFWMAGLLVGAALVAGPAVEAKGKGGDKGGKAKPSVSGKAKPSKKPKIDKGKGTPSLDKKLDKSDKKGGASIDKNDWRKVSKFEDKDRDAIVSHWDRYKGNDKGLPPGLAKNLRKGKDLPPGWDKKIRNGWVVEDDWWDLFDRVPSTDLPKDLKLPKDTGMYLFGDRMVRVHEPSREVVDFVKMPGIKP